MTEPEQQRKVEPPASCVELALICVLLVQVEGPERRRRDSSQVSLLALTCPCEGFGVGSILPEDLRQGEEGGGGGAGLILDGGLPRCTLL
ncbi:inaD-like protein isoform X1 [Lates japonicus]|uniref:InaD-like protein isoform X1 n=1 Tax=Lates japonicus TaxID=270547 RepID=A0AAD3RH57_LATJO|nr:inaD-like protein isoform X1 [Lates japonicus]